MTPPPQKGSKGPRAGRVDPCARNPSDPIQAFITFPNSTVHSHSLLEKRGYLAHLQKASPFTLSIHLGNFRNGTGRQLKIHAWTSLWKDPQDYKTHGPERAFSFAAADSNGNGRWCGRTHPPFRQYWEQKVILGGKRKNQNGRDFYI